MKKRIIAVAIILVAVFCFIVSNSSIQAATQYYVTFKVNNDAFGSINNINTGKFQDMTIETDASGSTIYKIPLDPDLATGKSPYQYSYDSGGTFSIKTGVGAKPTSETEYELVAWTNDAGLDMSALTGNQLDSGGKIVNRINISKLSKETNFTAYFKPIGSNVKTIQYKATTRSNTGTVVARNSRWWNFTNNNKWYKTCRGYILSVWTRD